MNRKLIKKEAKKFINQNLKYNIGLWFLIVILLIINTRLTNKVDVYSYSDIPLSLSILMILIAVALYISRSSVKYVTLDNLRLKAPTGKAYNQQSEILKGKYLLANIGITILTSIYIFCWLFLFIIGFVFIIMFGRVNIPDWMLVLLLASLIVACLCVYISKIISYKQASNIYKDAIDEGIKLTSKEAIKQSQKLMHGKKLDYIVFNLSFIPWILLSILTFGLAGFYVVPYIETSNQNYYIKLREKENI